MKRKNFRKVLENMTVTASVTATNAREAMQNAGKTVSEKYDSVKLELELARLSAEQNHVFEELGRILFLVRTGAVEKDTTLSEHGKTPAQLTDELLVSAEQVQQRLDYIEDKLAQFTGECACPLCGRACEKDDAFCAVCGAKLK